MPCVVVFLVLALFLWTMVGLLLRRALKNRGDPRFQKRLQELLEDEHAPRVGGRSSVGLWIAIVLLAVLAFGVSLCTSAVLFDPYVGFRR